MDIVILLLMLTPMVTGGRQPWMNCDMDTKVHIAILHKSYSSITIWEIIRDECYTGPSRTQTLVGNA